MLLYILCLSVFIILCAENLSLAFATDNPSTIDPPSLRFLILLSYHNGFTFEKIRSINFLKHSISRECNLKSTCNDGKATLYVEKMFLLMSGEKERRHSTTLLIDGCADRNCFKEFYSLFIKLSIL